MAESTRVKREFPEAKPNAGISDELNRRRNVIVEKQTALEQALLDAEIPREQQNIRLQLRLLRTGGLFLSPGDVAEPLTEIDRRIADFTARRDRAQASLDHYVRQAEEVLGEPVATTS